MTASLTRETTKGFVPGIPLSDREETAGRLLA
jgi:hypothetical protein